MRQFFFFNGKILTMDDTNKQVESVVVKDNKIIFAGSYEKGNKLIDENTKLIDLKGRTLLPGFNDSHMHLISYGLSKHKVDLVNANSISDIQEGIKQFVSTENKRIFQDWVLGHGWNHENFEEKRLPTKEDLDKIISDRPVYLSRACYHICVVNSKALELIGIHKDTKDPDGGKIDRDPITGEPTGILRENALYMAYNSIPVSDKIEDIKKVIKSSIKDANKDGITSIQTDDFSHLSSYQNIIEAYNQLKDERELNARINFQMLLENIERLKEFINLGIKTGDGDEWVRFGPLKVLGDGSLGSRTAALEESYSDDKTTNGMLIYSDEEIEELLTLAHTNGLQLAVHAIGNRCMNQVLDIYIKLNENYPEEDPRFRIVHCQIGSEEIYEKFKKLDVIGDIQPVFMKTDMHMAEDRVGEERMKWSYGWKSMMDKGIRLSGSSDAPVEPFNPILGIYTAVTRKDLQGNPEGGWYTDERLGLYESLKLFTTNSAYSTYEEDIKGMIKEGMLADLVVLSEDITSVSTDDIKEIEVDLTIVDGKIVFEK